MLPTPFFNAHHSPVGAFATFTLGMKGSNGGLGLELTGPANEPFYIGIENDAQPATYTALPFFGETRDAASDYDVEATTDTPTESVIGVFQDEQIKRTLTPSTDEWQAGELTFRITSPPKAIPESLGDSFALTPAVLVELTFDNTSGTRARKAFFGYAGADRTAGMRMMEGEGLIGVGQGTSIGIATTDSDVYAGLAWQPEIILNPLHTENLPFMLGSIGMLVGTVPAGELRTFTFAVGFYRDGTATSGIPTRYLYRRWFNSIEEVLSVALRQAEMTKLAAQNYDAQIPTDLSEDRKFMLSHAIHSYLGATELLERKDGKPLWVVNEGEYRMINTFDLAVDQVFFELTLNPWTVRNVLDLYVEKYSYEEELRFWGSDSLQPGGLTFTHDMGVSNNFSPTGHSSYEQAGLTGCFSYMSSEELMNWILTAGMYHSKTRDDGWYKQHQSTFERCFASMLNRDHPEDSQRNGIMGLDGNRCKGGAEITTYDSLDESLGQSRNNLYLGVKAWATYLVFEHVFGILGRDDLAAHAKTQAERAATTVAGAAEPSGMLPAVIGEGYDARIIPAIEALIYPHYAGLSTDGYEKLFDAVTKHFEVVLNPGICKFSDGGWKLSSTSNNSWLSKIYLCQAVAEKVLGYEIDHQADKAHVNWLLSPENIYFAWSDQMLSGKAVGSRYYPRGVTSILWV
jgi:xylan 1,4-beta-xylosidase